MVPNSNLWNDFLAGNKDALSELFLKYHDDLFRYGYKLSSDKDIAKDAIQDLFLKLWKNRLNLASVENPKPYLFKSLRNHIFDSLQLQKPMVSIQDDYENLAGFTYSPEDFAINAQVTEDKRIRVIEALNRLMPKQREAIFLRYIEELDFETIAGIMEIQIQSVRNNLQRGIAALRDLILLQPFFLFLGKEYLIYSNL